MIYLKEGRTPLNFAYSDEIVHDGNSTYQLSFKFPTNNPLWEELVEETLLLADDLHGEQEFIIFEVEKHHAYITVHANQVATLLNNYSITELSVNNASGDRVMRSLVGSIIREHKFTFSSDIASTHSINLKNVTVATALFKDKHSILGQWGGDLIRDKYDIRLLSNGGTNKEALFMYKKNLKSYQQKKSIKDLRTRIHFTKTINSQKEGEKDKVIAVTVDSPLISKYRNIYEGNLDVSDQDVIDEVTLRKYGEQYFKTTLCDVIEESIEIDVVGNPDVPVNIFDTVTVFHEKFNLDVKKKITKYTYTPMGRKLKTIGFGKIQQGLGTTLANMIDDAVTEHVESQVDAFKIQKNLSELLKLDRKSIEDKLVDLEEKSNSALEVKKALFEADGNIPDVVKTKILDAVEAEIGRLKTIITEAELIKAIQAKLDYAEIKNTLIDKAFINQIISDERFTQQFKDGEVTTQNIFTKLKDSIKSNISKDFVTKEGVKKLVNDLTIDADGIRQITQQESVKVFENKKLELKGVNAYLHKKYSDFEDGRNMDNNSNRKYIGIYTGDKQQAPTSASEYSWTKIKGEDGARGRDGNNGRDGTNGHSLTASLWLTGGYVNNAINDVKLNLKVFYDGREIRDFSSVITYKGGNFSSWQIKENPTVTSYNVIDYTFWSNGEKDGSTLFALATVTYNGLQAVADTRLDNVPDVRLLSETIKKYKTFESTLDGFTSVVGEIDTKVLSSAYFKNNLNIDNVEKTGNDLYFNAKENLVANEYYTILADLDDVPANQQTYMYGASDGGDKKIIQNGLNYWVVKYPDDRGNVNLYPLGANTKVKNVKVYKGDFRVKKDVERENLYSSSVTDSTGKFIQLHLNKNKINGNVYTVKFDASGYSNGDRWDIYNRVGYDGNNLTQVFKAKDNEFTFTINDDTNPIRMYIRMIEVGNTKISNVEIYDVSTEYVKNSQVSKLESSIKQTKDEIDLKVSKDNVIASINASVEKTGEGPAQGVVKINADKVDISGVLSAYTGEIGGFRIGYNYNDHGFWLTGSKNFECGINPGHNVGSRGAQLWAAWGNVWTNAGPNAWWVNAQGVMTCKNTPVFAKGMAVHGGVVHYANGTYTYSPNIKKIYMEEENGKTWIRYYVGSVGPEDDELAQYWNYVTMSGSDKRYKSNIKPTEVNGLEIINNLKCYDYDIKLPTDKESKHINCGIMAQDVEMHMNEAHLVYPNGIQSYTPFEMQPYLIKAIQELSTENQQLKSQLKEMNDRLNKLEELINGNL